MGQVLGYGRSQLPILARYSYGVGHVLNDLCAAMWFSYLLVYFHSVLQFSNVMAGYVMLLGQISDAVCTPLVGYESDNTAGRCRYGNRKSWHLVGTACVLVSFVFIFNPVLFGAPAEKNAEDWAQFIYYAPFVVIFQFGWATTQISHLSLIPELTRCESERVGLNAIRYSFTVMSSVFVYGMTWLLLSRSNESITTAAPPSPNDCDHDGDSVSTSLTNNIPEFRKLSFIVIGVGAFFSIVFHIGTKEKCLDTESDEAAEKRRRSNSEPMNWTDWLKESQFYQIAVLYMSSRLMVNVSQVYIPMYVTDTLNLDKESIAIVPLIIYISGWLSTFLQKLVNKVIGRKMTFFLGAVIFLGGCDWLWCDDIGHQVYGAAVLLGAGGSTVLVTSLSMTADLIGQNTESGAFVFGAMSFTDKLSNGIAVVIIQHIHPCQTSVCCEACEWFYQGVVVLVPGCAALLALFMLLTLVPIQIGHRTGRTSVPLTDDRITTDIEDSINGTISPLPAALCVNTDDEDTGLLIKNSRQNGHVIKGMESPTDYGAIVQ
ncbi:major facilitator superfamily domain-containing protein 12-like [Amphiura filiformis]|uniref:major facilitator superfamily domain-containing protein 12-like n=1 Tax=Amphiura filiformis TaxID=82378 RepID=UPI003B21AB87